MWKVLCGGEFVGFNFCLFMIILLVMLKKGMSEFVSDYIVCEFSVSCF